MSNYIQSFEQSQLSSNRSYWNMTTQSARPYGAPYPPPSPSSLNFLPTWPTSPILPLSNPEVGPASPLYGELSGRYYPTSPQPSPSPSPSSMKAWPTSPDYAPALPDFGLASPGYGSASPIFHPPSPYMAYNPQSRSIQTPPPSSPRTGDDMTAVNPEHISDPRITPKHSERAADRWVEKSIAYRKTIKALIQERRSLHKKVDKLSRKEQSSIRLQRRRRGLLLNNYQTIAALRNQISEDSRERESQYDRYEDEIEMLQDKSQSWKDRYIKEMEKGVKQWMTIKRLRWDMDDSARDIDDWKEENMNLVEFLEHQKRENEASREETEKLRAELNLLKGQKKSIEDKE